MFNIFFSAHEFTYQAIGILGAIVCILSFQIKNNKGFCIAQCIGSTLFAIQFYVGHAWAAAIMNTICIFRSITYAYVKDMKYRIGFTVLFSILFTVAAILAITVFKDIWFLAVLTGSASIVSSIGICTDNITINDCHVKGKIISQRYIGGLIGTITGNSNRADITGSSSSVDIYDVSDTQADLPSYFSCNCQSKF